MIKLAHFIQYKTAGEFYKHKKAHYVPLAQNKEPKMDDIDALEMATLENQQFKINCQLQMITTAYRSSQRALQMLMNTGLKYEPIADFIVYL